MSTGNPYAPTAEDLRRLERRRDSLDRALSRARLKLKQQQETIDVIEEDLNETTKELRELTEEWELTRGGHNT